MRKSRIVDNSLNGAPDTDACIAATLPGTAHIPRISRGRRWYSDDNHEHPYRFSAIIWVMADLVRVLSAGHKMLRLSASLCPVSYFWQFHCRRWSVLMTILTGMLLSKTAQSRAASIRLGFAGRCQTAEERYAEQPECAETSAARAMKTGCFGLSAVVCIGNAQIRWMRSWLVGWSAPCPHLPGRCLSARVWFVRGGAVIALVLSENS